MTRLATRIRMHGGQLGTQIERRPEHTIGLRVDALFAQVARVGTIVGDRHVKLIEKVAALAIAILVIVEARRRIFVNALVLARCYHHRHCRRRRRRRRRHFARLIACRRRLFRVVHKFKWIICCQLSCSTHRGRRHRLESC